MPAVGPTQQLTNSASRAMSLAQSQLEDHTSTSNTTIQFAVSLLITFLLILPVRFPYTLVINVRELAERPFLHKCITLQSEKSREHLKYSVLLYVR
jgi:hypothetical protein